MKKLSKEEILQLATVQGLLPPFNHPEEAEAKKILEAIYAGGLRIIEYTNRSSNAIDVFASLVAHAKKHLPELVIGVGTIMNARQARQFHKAGAQFIVAPTLNLEVGAYCSKQNLLWCPGAGTATEVVQAHDWGACLVKLFPAEILGPAFVRALKGPCPWTKVMPSGGVTLDEKNLKEWFDSGVECVAIGSQLFSKEIMKEGNMRLLEERIAWLLATIKKVRKGQQKS
jgi:2-dehydro-3-deoxyphosphogluconate aldolase / (4S)-4-hydroxy-2-oxoglutarate aldolase